MGVVMVIGGAQKTCQGVTGSTQKGNLRSSYLSPDNRRKFVDDICNAIATSISVTVSSLDHALARRVLLHSHSEP